MTYARRNLRGEVMNPEFPNSQTTLSGINFAIISQEVNRTLLIYQEAIRNFSQKGWSSLCRTPENTNDSHIQASLEENGIRKPTIFVKPAKPWIGFGKNIPGLSSDLTVEEVQEFQQIVKRVKDIDLSYTEAEDQATRMIKLALLLKQKRLLENQRG